MNVELAKNNYNTLILEILQKHMKNYSILYTVGENWEKGKSVYQQDLMAHGNYIQDLFEKGKVLLGGPYMNNQGGLTVIRVDNEQEAIEVVKNDPAVLNKVFKATLHPMHVVFKAQNKKELHLKK